MADLKERKIHDLYPIPYPKVDSKGIECIDLEEEEEEDKKQEVEIINLDDSSSSSTADEPPGHEILDKGESRLMYIPLTVQESERILRSMERKDVKPKPQQTWVMSENSTLKKVKAFIPEIKESNSKLQAGDPKVNIENVEEGEACIEMNLAFSENSNFVNEFDTMGSSSSDSSCESEEEASLD